MEVTREYAGWLAGTDIWGWCVSPDAPIGSVLLAAPFGEERKCALRLQVQLARRLATVGYRCLRVDVGGVADSGGSHGEATLAGWQAQFAQAAAILAAETPGHCHGVGARLGANLLLACKGLHDVVCWEPLVSGAAYLDELERRRAIKASAGGGGQEQLDFDGYLVSETLRDEFSLLDLSSQLRGQLDREVLLLHVTGAREPLGGWRDIAGQIRPPHSFQLLRQRPFWGRIDEEPREELIRVTIDFLLNADGRPVAGTGSGTDRDPDGTAAAGSGGRGL